MATHQTFNYSNYNNYRKLCDLYKVDYKTLMFWIHPIQERIRTEEQGNESFRLNLITIDLIVNFLGKPFAEDTEEHLMGFDFHKYNTIKSFAEFYNVDRKTFSNWLMPLWDEFMNKYDNRHKFYPKEQRKILDHFGLPSKADRKTRVKRKKAKKVEDSNEEPENSTPIPKKKEKKYQKLRDLFKF